MINYSDEIALEEGCLLGETWIYCDSCDEDFLLPEDTQECPVCGNRF